ncbi:hypothetical protein [Asticcacaulis machinosus]|uniref:Uncharacterized protein n=1 Tax=Asticcacaulis machinosus TaxID=2984211 RepID=A0ABT5HJU3_9CAUL|nr:hypothetical protein [Asticcacaulis machinosus]MDC7676520.1 hypothetical protein [Asticcacaulis machinosus]
MGVTIGMTQAEADQALITQGFGLKGTHGCTDQSALCQMVDTIATYRKDGVSSFGYVEVHTKAGRVVSVRWWKRPREIS